jgi:hypothetical protein
VGDDGKLITESLERFGKVLIFGPLKSIAGDLYDEVKLEHASVRFAVENDEENAVRRPLMHDVEGRCVISYSRGVLGAGVNLDGFVTLVVDCNAFRHISGLNPGDISPEGFAEARAAECLALLSQNIGRMFRGESGKNVVLILLNADPELRASIREFEAIKDGAELSPIFAEVADRGSSVLCAAKWLENGGGDLSDLAEFDVNRDKGGRPKRTLAEFEALTEAAIKEGVKWRAFANKYTIRNAISPDQVAELKERFGKPNSIQIC